MAFHTCSYTHDTTEADYLESHLESILQYYEKYHLRALELTALVQDPSCQCTCLFWAASGYPYSSLVVIQVPGLGAKLDVLYTPIKAYTGYITEIYHNTCNSLQFKTGHISKYAQLIISCINIKY